MSKIKNTLKNIQNTLHEWNNADEIAKTSPYKILYDMQYYFARNPGVTIYSNKFRACFTIQDHEWFYDATYKKLVAQTQILLHGLAYKRILDFYNQCLAQEIISDKSAIITQSEYNKIPKRYRDVFCAYKDGFYRLNIPSQPTVIAIKRNHKSVLLDLLNQASKLISTICLEKILQHQPDIICGGLDNLNQKPDFTIKNANGVTDEQLSTLHKLYDIFIEIAKITTPFDTKYSEIHIGGAWQLYNEYLDEQNRKDRYPNAIKSIKKEQTDAYNSIRQNYINKLKENFIVNCK